MRTTLARVARGTAHLLMGVAVLAALSYAVLFAAGYRTLAVYSASMEPVLGVGSLAFVEPVPASELRVGDVITFTDPYRNDRLVTHRVAAMAMHEGRTVYRTKGDANAARDPWTIELPAEAGRVAFDVPYAGYALFHLRTPAARTILILFTSSLALLAVLRAIWRQPATSGALRRAA